MRHKAQAIFDKFVQILTHSKEAIYSRFLVINGLAVLLEASPNMEKRENEEDVISYITLIFKDSETRKKVLAFSVNSAGGMVLCDECFDEAKLMHEKYVNLLVTHLGLEEQFKTPITVKEIEPIPPNANPYNYDAWRQGCDISKHWHAMFSSKGNGEIDNLILIHTKTGRRFDLDLFDAEKPLTS